ncbi:MAG TPA: ROK family protein [Caulobacteraceae bacterium]|nr:ROK family protein [Caulobacteraceae bacterium]
MIRIGVDFGGTKIEAAALDERGQFQARVRAPNPGEYEAALDQVVTLVREAERQAGGSGPIGVGAPGSVSPRTGMIRNANSTWLNGRPLPADLERRFGQPVRTANDANCFALSEAVDGAAAGAGVVFGAILGTGVGGGVVINGQAREGRNGIAGEWGHTPLPWATERELPPRGCWCGRENCLELYISGTGLEHDAGARPAEKVVAAALQGQAGPRAALDRYIDRLGRALAVIVDILDPDVIVLGGGMSNVDELYSKVPPITAERIFSDVFETPIVRARHGDSSGVRGAAWLWPLT